MFKNLSNIFKTHQKMFRYYRNRDNMFKDNSKTIHMYLKMFKYVQQR